MVDELKPLFDSFSVPHSERNYAVMAFSGRFDTSDIKSVEFKKDTHYEVMHEAKDYPKLTSDLGIKWQKIRH